MPVKPAPSLPEPRHIQLRIAVDEAIDSNRFTSGDLVFLSPAVAPGQVVRRQQ